MAKEVVLPQLGQSMREGTIVKMRVQAGQTVNPGDILYDIETDKATLEVESADGGVVRAVLVQIGQTVPVRTPVLVLGDADEDISSFLEQLSQGSDAAGGEASLSNDSSSQVKTIADELGIDVSGVTPAEAIRVVEADLRHAAAEKTRKTSDFQLGQSIPLTRLQKVVAEKMVYSKQNIPCFYLNVRVDMTRVIALRSQLNESQDMKISFNDVLIRALALSIAHYPIMTGRLADEYIQLAERIDIGLAVSTPYGLVAPIIKDCGNKTLPQISRTCSELIERTENNTLTLDDLEGGCITVSNLGGFGVDSFIPIVVPGQTSILGVGGIYDAVLPENGQIGTRKVMNLTLSVDHKVVNGAEAAQFLDFVKKMLEHTSELI